ncbi:ATP-binding protein [Falsiroseomonas sp. HW251]|uniref:ATP-binding protein n=1 Tax=Falsiroseomonas sp. HW251 TaxID=3390998 RepID=UPI003D3150A0
MSVAILAMVLLFLAALVGLRVDSLRTERADALARAETSMLNLTGVAEQYAQRVFETSGLLADQVAARLAQAEGGLDTLRDREEAHRWLRNLVERGSGDYLMVLDAEGRPVATSFMFPAPAVALADRRFFQAHLAGAETHLGEALIGRVTEEILFTFSRALRRPDGRFDGVVQVAILAGFFDQPGLSAEFRPGTRLGLFDAEGRVLAMTGLDAATVRQGERATALAAEAAARSQGILEGQGFFGGTDGITAFRRVTDWPVFVAASVPMEEVLGPWRRSVRWSVELVGLLGAALLLLAAQAVRLSDREARIRRELAAANDALRAAAAGLEENVAGRTRDLAASEARFRVLFDSTFQLMSLTDAKGVVLEVNETALAFLGQGRMEVLGRRLSSLPCWPDAATRAGLASGLARAAAGEVVRAEITARGGDGRLSPLTVALRPVRDEEGEVAFLVAEGHDVTELKATEARLREAQKMEALGQLTGGVAHDFNNLLMVVLGNLGLLRKRLPSDPRLLRLLDGAQQGAERGAALTNRMLAFARRQELRPAPVQLGPLVAGLRPLLERSAGPKARIELRLGPGLPPALADANQVELALLNLVVNARDAMPDGGTITITATEAEAPDAGAPPGLLPGPYLALSIGDTGTGMDTATLARATEPFFTTKGVGRGSGLGLSMVQGLAQQSGGGLTLRSEPGRGTTATIWLPRAAAMTTPDAESPARVVDAVATPARRVLVVDDDALVAAGTAMMLEDLGHRTEVVTSAEEALDVIARDPPDLVITDHVMPGISGLEMAERLRRDRPDLPVVLATGYAEATGASPWLPRLNKPYRQHELGELVRRLTRAEAA